MWTTARQFTPEKIRIPIGNGPTYIWQTNDISSNCTQRTHPNSSLAVSRCPPCISCPSIPLFPTRFWTVGPHAQYGCVRRDQRDARGFN